MFQCTDFLLRICSDLKAHLGLDGFDIPMTCFDYRTLDIRISDVRILSLTQLPESGKRDTTVLNTSSFFNLRFILATNAVLKNYSIQISELCNNIFGLNGSWFSSLC